MRGNVHRWTMVSRGEPVAHQLPGGMAAFHAVMRKRKNNAVTYWVGAVSPSSVRDLWLWFMNRHHPDSGTHACVLNTVADEESRVMKGRPDWRLNHRSFTRSRKSMVHRKCSFLHPG